MANFLQVSEPEAAALDAQSYASANAQRLHNQAANALVSQYGPQAADPEMQKAAIDANTAAQTQPDAIQQEQQKTQGNQITLDNATLAQKQAHVLGALQALKQATDSGIEIGTAYDSIIAPNAQLYGMSPEETAHYRQVLTSQPGAVDSLINGLQGPAKPAGAPQLVKDANGNLTSEIQLDERGGQKTINAPDGGSFVGPASMAGYQGAPQVEILPDGTSGYRLFPKTGGSILVHADGTPVKAMTAQTGAYNANVRANNSVYGAGPGAVAPSGAPASVGGVPTSYTGNVGPGQIGQKFWQTFARQGESISNPTDNIAVANRGIDYYMKQYNDPARAAVAYYSGPSNVAPKGSATPYIRDIPARAGGAGPTTSAYTAQVMARVNSGMPVNQAILHQESGNAAFGGAAAPQDTSAPLFNRLPPKGRMVATGQAEGIVNTVNALQRADQQIASIKAAMGNPLATGALGQATGWIGGSPGYDMAGQVGQLKALGLQDYIQSLKQGGPGGAGGLRIKSEADAAMQAYGNLDPNLSPPVFRQHLELFQQAVHQLSRTAQAGFIQQWGVDPFTAAGVQRPGAASAPQPSAGWSVVGVR